MDLADMATVFAAIANSMRKQLPDGERRRRGRVIMDGVTCSLGEIENLTHTGLCIRGRGKCPLRENMTSLITVNTPKGPVRLEVRVAWVSQTGGWLSRSFRMGFEIRNLTEEARNTLTNVFKDGVSFKMAGMVAAA